jgi:hypothetical protein
LKVSWLGEHAVAQGFVEPVEDPRVRYRGGEPALAGDGAGHPVLALADPLNRDALGICVGSPEGEVHGRGNHLPSVVTEVEPLQVQRRALPGPVEGEGVISAL